MTDGTPCEREEQTSDPRFERNLKEVAVRFGLPLSKIKKWQAQGCPFLHSTPYEIPAIVDWLKERAKRLIAQDDPMFALERRRKELEVQKLERDGQLLSKDKSFWLTVIALGVPVAKGICDAIFGGNNRPNNVKPVEKPSPPQVLLQSRPSTSKKASRFPSSVEGLLELILAGRGFTSRHGFDVEALRLGIERFWANATYQLIPASQIYDYCREVAILIKDLLLEHVNDNRPEMANVASDLLSCVGLYETTPMSNDDFYSCASSSTRDLGNLFIRHWKGPLRC